MSTPDAPTSFKELKPPSLEDESDLWKTERVAQYLHVSLKTVFNLRKNGLPFVKLGGAVRFIPEEVKDYLATHRDLVAHRLRQQIRKGQAP